MKKRKTLVAYSIDIEIANKFDEFCERNGFKKSHLVERLIKEFLEVNERGDKQ